MKNIILLIIASLILSSCFMGSSLLFMESEIQDKPNLVLNPSFDAYSFAGTDALRGWTIYTKPDDSEFNKIRIDPMQSIDGDTSLRIDASNKDVVIISDSFDVRRYGGYYSRIRFKTDSPQPPQARLRCFDTRFGHSAQPTAPTGSLTLDCLQRERQNHQPL